MAFGQNVASDNVGGSGGEWIRNFKDDETQIRIMPAEAVNKKGNRVFGTSAWPQEFEHFDRGIGFGYPCTGEDDCVGCSSKDKEVKKASRKIYVYALDEDGVPRIYRMGPMLYKRLKSKEQRALARDPKNLQPLSDRDYIILRSGSKMDTEYDCEPGDEAYEVDWPEDDELPDLSDSLAEAYEQAVDAYNGYGDDDDEEDDEPVRASSRRSTGRKAASSEEDDEPAPRKRAAKKAATKKAAAKKAEPEEPEEDDEDEEEPAPRKRAARKTTTSKKAVPEEPEEDEADEGLGDNPSDEDFQDASTAELKAYLEDNGIEFPPRAPRKRLIEIAMTNPPY